MLIGNPMNRRRRILNGRERGKLELRGRHVNQNEPLDGVLGPKGNDSVAVKECKVGTVVCQYQSLAPKNCVRHLASHHSGPAKLPSSNPFRATRDGEVPPAVR